MSLINCVVEFSFFGALMMRLRTERERERGMDCVRIDEKKLTKLRLCDVENRFLLLLFYFRKHAICVYLHIIQLI